MIGILIWSEVSTFVAVLEYVVICSGYGRLHWLVGHL